MQDFLLLGVKNCKPLRWILGVSLIFKSRKEKFVCSKKLSPKLAKNVSEQFFTSHSFPRFLSRYYNLEFSRNFQFTQVKSLYFPQSSLKIFKDKNSEKLVSFQKSKKFRRCENWIKKSSHLKKRLENFGRDSQVHLKNFPDTKKNGGNLHKIFQMHSS